MKIAIISPGSLPLPAVRGGAVETLIETLVDYNESKNLFDLNIFSIHDKESELLSMEYKNSKFIYLKANKFLLYLATKKIIPMRFYYRIYCYFCRKKLSETKFDVIIIENEFIYANIIKKVIKNTTLILHLHNDYINSSSKSILNLDGIITISNYLKNNVQKSNKSIYIETIHNGIDLNLFNSENYYLDDYHKLNIRKKYGIKKDDIVIIYTGRLIEEKGVIELISAVNLIDKDNVKLIICGSSGFKGSKETKYIKQLKKKAEKCNGSIIFTGFIDNKKLPYLYQCADIGCVPSVWEEAFGLTVIEQMASGLPLVVSDSGGIPEIVNEDCAITVKRDENYICNMKLALERLCNDKALRKKMGKNALECSKKFSKEIYAKSFFDLINKIVKK